MWLCLSSAPAGLARPVQLALLDLGETETAAHVADLLTQAFAKLPDFTVVNRAQARAAARGVGYTGSLNLSLAEARDLGAAVGCDFFVTGAAETLRRSAFDRADYYEAYAALFFVSSRTGRLLLWEQPSVEAATAPEAEKAMLAELTRRVERYAELLRTARAAEHDEKLLAITRDTPVIADVSDADSADSAQVRAPRPYRRLQPAYPAPAAHMSAEATVDALVEIDADGEVRQVEIVRWAGYGLNEAVVATVRQMHFFPALRAGQPVPVHALLRYNFRKPAQASKE
ncbi:MAG: TonB family protein [Pyrinomonadaceae bacterium]